MLTEAGKWKIDLEAEHTVYKNAAGKRLPGVTTVLGNLDKPALRGWYADMEREHVLATVRRMLTNPVGPFGYDAPAESPDPDEFVRDLRSALGEKWAADVKKDRAADIGTVTHARCEAFLHGVELDEEGLDSELLRKSLNGFVRFQGVWAREGLVIVASEKVMVSESLQVGGTADIVAIDPQGLLVLRDLKTSKASKWWPYPEVFAQTAAYAFMWEEETGRRIDRIEVDRIGKEENDPGQTYRVSESERAAGLRLFRAALEVHNAKKEIGR